MFQCIFCVQETDKVILPEEELDDSQFALGVAVVGFVESPSLFKLKGILFTSSSFIQLTASVLKNVLV